MNTCGRRPSVTFLTRVLPHYRVKFHDAVFTKLRNSGVDYRLIYGQPTPSEASKADTAHLEWADEINNVYVVDRLVWQPAIRQAFSADLVILGQENGLLLNYLVQSFSPKRVALFGHGKNFQSRSSNGLAERWKGWWSTQCHWWFAYTEECRRIVCSRGFPEEKVTVFQNAIDTTEIRSQLAELTVADISATRRKQGLLGSNVAIYTGGMYADKRIDFLLAAADLIRRDISDFELILVGSGPALQEIMESAKDRPWVKIAGPVFGREKAALLATARVFLFSGLAGLGVLDAAAAGLPVVATNYPYHSPEFRYIEEFGFGRVSSDWTSARAYADAVVRTLHDEQAMVQMRGRAVAAAEQLTIENMSDRFSAGVLFALK